MEIKVALRVLYVGYKYHGFAMQENYQTIELLLENALKKVNLIKDLKTCDWSKCGRTDIGVSSWSQIVAFRIIDKRFKGLDEILNNVLPREIRVLGVSKVSMEFDARFSCVERKYKYYFPAQGLNLLKMQQGAQEYKGTRNFKNFCKVNPTKETRYKRTISKSYIQPLGKEDEELLENNLPEKEDDPNRFYVFVIQGRAFLWHQVRCFVSCLFMVGMGLEEPRAIHDLLQEENVIENKGRPHYDMAPDGPLVLVDCIYPPGTFDWESFSEEKGTFTKNILMPLYLQWKDYATKSKQMESVIGDLIAKDSNSQGDPKEYLKKIL